MFSKPLSRSLPKKANDPPFCFSLFHYSLFILHYFFRLIFVLSLIQRLKTSEGMSRPALTRSSYRAVNVFHATSDFCCGAKPLATARSINWFALLSSPFPKLTVTLFLIISPSFGHEAIDRLLLFLFHL